jgi:hypothetical protein
MYGEGQLAKGNVRWFKPTKGYGYIQPLGGGKDAFVHIEGKLICNEYMPRQTCYTIAPLS